MEFMATLHKVSVDKEGESRVTLTVPQSDLDTVMALAKSTEKLLSVNVEIQDL